MVKMKIRYLFQLIGYFIITEMVSAIELILWLQFREFFVSLMSLENDVFGIRYAVPLLLVVIPVVSALVVFV